MQLFIVKPYDVFGESIKKKSRNIGGPVGTMRPLGLGGSML